MDMGASARGMICVRLHINRLATCRLQAPIPNDMPIKNKKVAANKAPLPEKKLDAKELDAAQSVTLSPADARRHR